VEAKKKTKVIYLTNWGIWNLLRSAEAIFTNTIFETEFFSSYLTISQGVEKLNL
jgi:uncharacterized membrane protein